MSAEGIEGDLGTQRQEAQGGASVGISGGSTADVPGAEGAKVALDERDCHAVTHALEEALRQLDAGRVDLGREAIQRALEALRSEGGA